MQLAYCVGSIQSGSKLGHKAQETVRVRQAALETGEALGMARSPTHAFSHGMLYHASICAMIKRSQKQYVRVLVTMSNNMYCNNASHAICHNDANDHDDDDEDENDNVDDHDDTCACCCRLLWRWYSKESKVI